MHASPDFGRELRRPFNVDERCYDCAELYHGCNARPENPSSRCADYFPLPTVGVNGQTGQEIPPSRMGGRKDPRVRSATGGPTPAPAHTASPPAHRRTPAKPEPTPEPVEQDPADSRQPAAPGPDSETPPAIDTPPSDRPAAQPTRKTHQPYPVALRGLAGERSCGCGAVLPKRKRCCERCRLQRREATMHRRRSQGKPSAAVYAVSGLPFTPTGTASE